MKKIIFLILGFLTLSVGIVGMILPILPTTPFVLVAATCFSLSSKKLHEKLVKNRFFGPYIKHYREKTGLPLKTKIYALTSLYLTLTVSALLASNLYVSLILLAVAVGVTIHILTIKPKKPQKDQQMQTTKFT